MLKYLSPQRMLNHYFDNDQRPGPFRIDFIKHYSDVYGNVTYMWRREAVDPNVWSDEEPNGPCEQVTEESDLENCCIRIKTGSIG